VFVFSFPHRTTSFFFFFEKHFYDYDIYVTKLLLYQVFVYHFFFGAFFASFFPPFLSSASAAPEAALRALAS